MTNTHLNTTEYRVDSFVNVISNNKFANNICQITGSSSSGKRRVLNKLYSQLKAEGKQPIIVEPPRYTHDAGPYCIDLNWCRFKELWHD